MIPFAMWTPSIWELGVILVIVLVLFGPGKLPQVFSQLGSAVRKFRDAAKEDDSAPVDVTPKRRELADQVEEAEEVKHSEKA